MEKIDDPEKEAWNKYFQFKVQYLDNNSSNLHFELEEAFESGWEARLEFEKRERARLKL